MGVRLGPNETEAVLRPDFRRAAVSEVGPESANLRKPWGFQRLDRGSGEFEKVHWRREGDSISTRWAEGRETVRNAAGSRIGGVNLWFSLGPAG